MNIAPINAAEVDPFLSLIRATIASSPYYTEEAKSYEMAASTIRPSTDWIF